MLKLVLQSPPTMGCPYKLIDPVYLCPVSNCSLSGFWKQFYAITLKKANNNTLMYLFFCILGCVVHLFVCVADILPRSPCAAHVYQFYVSAWVVGVSAAFYHIVWGWYQKVLLLVGWIAKLWHFETSQVLSYWRNWTASKRENFKIEHISIIEMLNWRDLKIANVKNTSIWLSTGF